MQGFHNEAQALRKHSLLSVTFAEGEFTWILNTGTSYKSPAIGEYVTIAGISWRMSTACVCLTGEAQSPGCKVEGKSKVKGNDNGHLEGNSCHTMEDASVAGKNSLH